MSKIGKKNIIIPKESSIKIEGSNLTISGPKGTTKLTINDKIFSSKLNESEFQLLPLEKKIDKKIILKKLTSISPLAVPIILEINRENLSKKETDEYILEDLENEILKEANVLSIN